MNGIKINFRVRVIPEIGTMPAKYTRSVKIIHFNITLRPAVEKVNPKE
jgi:hypothetical protein